MFDSEDDRYRVAFSKVESTPFECRARKHNPIDVDKYKEMIKNGDLRGLTFNKKLWFQEYVENQNSD